MSDTAIQKLAVIGLDGATFDLINPWIEAGDLPTFERLLSQSAFGRLRSTIHPLSPQAWSTFMTGMNAGKHGLFDFLVKKPGTYQFALTHGGARRGASLWRMLSEADRRVIVANVPFTYPPEPVNGAMISGFDAPRADETLCYPSDLYQQITTAVGDYYLHNMYPVGYGKAEYGAVLESEVENRLQVTHYFLDQYEWDFYMIVVNATDLVQHLFWAEMENPESPYRDEIRRVYQRVDSALGEVWSRLGPETTLLVMSDHGAGPIEKSFYLNEWLRQQGWLAYQEQTLGTAQRVASGWIDIGRQALKRHLPRSTKDWLKQTVPGFRNRVESWIQTSKIDWSRTRAFAGGKFGDIYLNLREREPEGTVEAGGERERLVAEITGALLALQDPTSGQRVVEQVHARENLYQGPFVDRAPDLIIQWRDYAYFAASELEGTAGDVFGPPPVEDATDFRHTGTHRMDGILLICGPGIQPGRIEGARIADLAPTILHGFGLPVPHDMDGKVLQSVFREPRPVSLAPSHTTDAQKQSRSAYSEAEESEMAERLRALGYLD